VLDAPANLLGRHRSAPPRRLKLADTMPACDASNPSCSSGFLLNTFANALRIQQQIIAIFHDATRHKSS